MLRTAYSEFTADDSLYARQQEWFALGRSVDLLIEAKQTGPRSRESIEALLFVRRLWTLFIEDLGSPGNSLPQELRASLISIGLWILSQEEEIRMERSEDYDGLIEISKLIMDGLK